MRGPARRLTFFLSVAALAAALTAVPAAVTGETAPKAALNDKEREAIQIRSVEISGDESLGILVTAKFGGNITDVIGRKHLTKASIELVLRPASSDFDNARIVTKRAGLIGRTFAKTSSKKVGVVRDGRTLTFFNFGPGYSRVATAEVRVHVPSHGGARAARDETSGKVPVPQATPSRTELENELANVDAALKTAQEAQERAKSLLKGIEKFLNDIDNGTLLNKVASLITQFENWKYSVKQTTTEEGVANLKKSRDDVKKQIEQVNATIDDLHAQRKKIKDKLATFAPQPDAPTGTGRLVRPPEFDCPSNPSCHALNVFVKSDQALSGFTMVVASGYIVAGGGAYLPDGTQIGQCTFGTTNTQYDTLTCGFTEQPAGTEVRANTSVSTPDGSSRYPAGTGATGQLTTPRKSATFTLTGP